MGVRRYAELVRLSGLELDGGSYQPVVHVHIAVVLHAYLGGVVLGIKFPFVPVVVGVNDGEALETIGLEI